MSGLSNNIKIISEFEKLVSFIQNEIDNMKLPSDTKMKTANIFRLKQIKNALYTIKKFPKTITEKNLEEFAELPGIGKGTIERIKEILSTGKLSELDKFVDISMEDKKALEDLESVVGIGRSKALELMKEGIHSVKELKKAIEDGSIVVNEKIELGVKYYKVFQGDIPRKEITTIHKLLSKVIDKLNKTYKLDDNNKYIFEICGSYRRDKPTSGDIDILVSKLGKQETSTNHLERFIELIQKPLKNNDDMPLLVDNITDNFETKYMGFAKYKDNPVRRIDIRYVPYESYFSALVYFTGSAELNKMMRKVAKTMNLKLSEYGLTKEDGSMIPIKSEHDIFKILEIAYLPPNLR